MIQAFFYEEAYNSIGIEEKIAAAGVFVSDDCEQGFKLSRLG